MKTDLYNQNAEVVGDFDLPDKVFGLAPNTDLMKQVLEAQSGNSRQVLAHTKGRGEVRGGGRKPWKQKGTGRARHGSIRSPIWKGGGVAFGPTKERNFEKKINKKMRRKALFMALSSKVKDKEILVLNDLKFEMPKTKIAMGVFKTLSAKMDGYKETKKKHDSILLVTPKQNKEIFRTIGNIPFINTTSAKDLNIRDVLEKKYLVLLKDSVPVITDTFKI
jgi:large subunit ribosomal protein L4